jgi:hypothetical protein
VHDQLHEGHDRLLDGEGQVQIELGELGLPSKWPPEKGQWHFLMAFLC